MNRKLLILGLGLALALGTSCTGDLPLETVTSTTSSDGGAATPPDTTGVVPSDTSGAVPPDTSGATPSDTTLTEPGDTAVVVPADSSVSQVDLLACEPQRYAVEVMVIGPAGGQLRVGNHKLTIMAGALTQEVPIVMEQIEGTVNSVRLSPEGLEFAIPAILSLSYKNCPNDWHPKRIAYTDESLNILEVLPSFDFNKASQVKGLIEHFSRYAVAY